MKKDELLVVYEGFGPQRAVESANTWINRDESGNYLRRPGTE